MSLILDALRKSETQRQLLGSVALADLPRGKRYSPPWWMIAVGVLLVANAMLLGVVLFRSNETASSAIATPNSMAANNVQASGSTHQSIQSVKQTPSNAAVVPQHQVTSLADAALSTPEAEYETVDRSVMEAATSSRDLADGPRLVHRATNVTSRDQETINMLSSSAPSSVPPLQLQMHVTAPSAADRFVFINGHKYTEGQTLTEGPRVESIVTEGVILSMNGTRWRIERP